MKKNQGFVNSKVIDKSQEIRKVIFSKLEEITKITDVPVKGIGNIKVTLFPENGKNGKRVMIKVLPQNAWKGALFSLTDFKAFVKEIRENEERLTFLANALSQKDGNSPFPSSGELEI